MKRTFLFLLGVAGSLFLLLWLSTFGTIKFSMQEVISILLGNLTGTRASLYLKLRLPRVLVAFVIGCGLAVSGEGLQLTLKNPLADPYIIGISAGASFGAVLALVLKESGAFSANMDLFAFMFALLSAFLTYYISRRGGKVPVTSLILSGVIVSFLFNAAVTFMVVFSWRNILTLHFWSMGSLASVTWTDLYKLLPAVIIEIAVFVFLRRKMLILAAGEEHAITVGINPERIKLTVFFVVSFISALTVSSAGLIGFVGLVIPHMIRLAFGVDSKLDFPATAIVGGIFLLACDTLSRTMFQPTELPIGAVTALVGAPVFIYLLRKSEVIKNG